MKPRFATQARRGLSGAAIVAILLCGLTAGPALAKGPGGGGGGHHSSDPPCSVSPSSMHVGDSYTISVGGLASNLPLNVDVSYTGTLQVFAIGSDDAGSLSLTATALQTGSSGVTIYDITRSRPALVSSCSFTVT